jgi:hypothetical protein
MTFMGAFCLFLVGFANAVVDFLAPGVCAPTARTGALRPAPRVPRLN